jgi:hypothetical protein
VITNRRAEQAATDALVAYQVPRWLAKQLAGMVVRALVEDGHVKPDPDLRLAPLKFPSRRDE